MTERTSQHSQTHRREDIHLQLVMGGVEPNPGPSSHSALSSRKGRGSSRSSSSDPSSAKFTDDVLEEVCDGERRERGCQIHSVKECQLSSKWCSPAGCDCSTPLDRQLRPPSPLAARVRAQAPSPTVAERTPPLLYVGQLVESTPAQETSNTVPAQPAQSPANTTTPPDAVEAQHRGDASTALVPRLDALAEAQASLQKQILALTTLCATALGDAVAQKLERSTVESATREAELTKQLAESERRCTELTAQMATTATTHAAELQKITVGMQELKEVLLRLNRELAEMTAQRDLSHQQTRSLTEQLEAARSACTSLDEKMHWQSFLADQREKGLQEQLSARPTTNQLDTQARAIQNLEATNAFNQSTITRLMFERKKEVAAIARKLELNQGTKILNLQYEVTRLAVHLDAAETAKQAAQKELEDCRRQL